MNVEIERNILQHATMLAGASLKVDDSRKQQTLERLKEYETALQSVTSDIYSKIKKEALLTVRAAIRYLTDGKQSDAKKTRRHGEKVAKEFGRLARIAKRAERDQ